MARKDQSRASPLLSLCSLPNCPVFGASLSPWSHVTNKHSCMHLLGSGSSRHPESAATTASAAATKPPAGSGTCRTASASPTNAV